MEGTTVKKEGGSKPSKVNAKLIGNIAPYVGLILVIVVFGILTEGALLSVGNLQAMANTVILTALCTIGSVFVFGAGYFDMSVGGSLCLSAVLGAMAMIASGSLLVGFIAILAVSLVLALLIAGCLCQCALLHFHHYSGLCVQCCGAGDYGQRDYRVSEQCR